jgi:outer membrane protein W
MKRKLLFALALFALSYTLEAQPGKGSSVIQAGGGFTSVIFKTTSETAGGYMLNALYEKWLAEGVGTGVSINYMHVANESETGTGKGSSLPILLTVKYYVGKSQFRPFVMGAAGMQFSWRTIDYISENSTSDHDAGFAAAFGAGLLYAFNPKVALDLNYSLYLMKNAYYSNGLANTVSLNICFILGQ